MLRLALYTSPKAIVVLSQFEKSARKQGAGLKLLLNEQILMLFKNCYMLNLEVDSLNPLHILGVACHAERKETGHAIGFHFLFDFVFQFDHYIPAV